MPWEIERKFLVNKDKLQLNTTGVFMCQAYLTDDPSRTVRVRIVNNQAFITIKGPTDGISRKEFEYSIPVEDARELIKMAVCPAIEKTRYKISFREQIWELDIFHGKNEGLMLAEIELESEDQKIVLPEWVQKEVSDDYRYFNSFLAKYPYQSWDESKMV